MFKPDHDYIKKYKADNPNHVQVRIWTEEDYDPETDGYHIDLVCSMHPLSLPQDNSGTSDIDRIMMHLAEIVNPHELKPATQYRLTLVECYEEDGWPHMMQTWAVSEVETWMPYASECPTCDGDGTVPSGEAGFVQACPDCDNYDERRSAEVG